MMNNLQEVGSTQRIARFQSISAGYYWRALHDIPEHAITKDMVLLIESIRYVDDAPHTIIVRAHPLNYGKWVDVRITEDDGSRKNTSVYCKTHRFLTEDFLDKFEYEPDHEEIRRSEIGRIQSDITELQSDLARAQSDPTLLTQVVNEELRKDAEKAAKDAKDTDNENSSVKNLPVLPEDVLSVAATGSLAQVIGSGITEAKVGALKGAAEQEHRVATIKSSWLQAKTDKISEKIQAMTPFYGELAAAALARTEDVREHVNKLMKGIKSLDLYTGKDVHVDTICKGKSAPASEPLTCVQRRLSMEEELAIWEDLDADFDHHDQQLFFDALAKHPELVDQVFPAARCILLMNTTTRLVDYGNDTLTNAVHNRENRRVFLMVRDGANIYRVVSSVESHLDAGRLFPSKDDSDRRFRGLDGTRITLQDVAYTDHLARHEDHVLHYKRFLILLCGLDHRLQLFGTFYDGPRDFSFVTTEFQDRNIRFIHDDDGEGMLPEEERPSFESYVNTLNNAMQSGSRVLCIWSALMRPETAPSCCLPYRFGSSSGYDWKYRPENPHDVCIVQRNRQDLVVKISVSGDTFHFKRRSFEAKVRLRSAMRPERYHRGNMLCFLCLDLADPDKLEWYIHNRKTRKFHLSYIKTFKRAVAILRADQARERRTRDRMLAALTEHGIATSRQAGSIIDQSIAAWRASNRGADLPDFEAGEGTTRQWKSLLNQMHLLAGAGEERAQAILRYASNNDLEPLRLSIGGNGVMLLYAAPSAAERDDRAEPFVWVRRYMTKASKGGVSVTSERWARLEQNPPGETVVREFDGAKDWIGRTSVFTTPMQKAAVLSRADGFAEWLTPFTKAGNAIARELELDLWNQAREQSMSRYVPNLSIAVPLGVIVKDGDANYICVGTNSPVGMLCRDARPSFIDEARDLYVRRYANKGAARKRFESELSEAKWKLATLPLSEFAGNHQTIYHDRDVVSGWHSREFWRGADDDQFDPRLTSSLDVLRAKHDLWITPQAITAEGELLVDAMLGLDVPDNFAPVTLREVTVYARGSSSPALAWFDIIPRGFEDYEIDIPDAYRIKYFTAGRHLNAEAALEAVSERLADQPFMERTDTPQAPFPLPDGPKDVTRVYFQPVQHEEMQ